MPIPMQSCDPGEAWVWGNFFATLQKNPKVMSQHMQAMAGMPVTESFPMTYPYAMTVFYDKAKNPHGPSSRPVLCVGLEQMDYDALNALPGGDTVLLGGKQSGKGPLVVGVFHGGGRANLGEFDGVVSADSARERFFAVIRSQLGLSGEPVRIGTIKDVFGHPNTGWPAQSEPPPPSKKNRRSIGSLALLAWMLLLVAAFVYLMFHLN